VAEQPQEPRSHADEPARPPRAEKAATGAEIRDCIAAAEGFLLTEYRGLNTAAMASLRAELAPVGGSYKVYKNRLVKLAAHDLGIDCDEVLVGPTALAFVNAPSDQEPADVAAIAKILLGFRRANPQLVIKGGVLGTSTFGPEAVDQLSKLPSTEVMRSQMAGALAAPLSQMAGALAAPIQEAAGLFKAVLTETAGLLKALIDKNS